MKAFLGRERVAVTVVFVAAMFMSVMDLTIVNVALPSIGRELHVSPARYDALSIGYLVSLAVITPVSGWLGDQFGGKRTMLLAVALFTGASVLCAVAQSFGQLVVFRVLQGLGGGLLAPVGMTMLFRCYPVAERARVASVVTAPTALAPALGPVLGGFLVDNLSWRWVFWVNVPIGVLACCYGWAFLPDDHRAGSTNRFDWVGFALSGLGLPLLMYGLSEGSGQGWSEADVLGATCVGALLLAVLVSHQRRSARPLLNLRLFADRLFRSTTATVFMAAAAFMGSLYLVALLLQDGLGLTALESGLSTFPDALGVLVGSQVASRVLYPRFGPRVLMTGGLVAAATMLAMMMQIDAASELGRMRALMFLLGFAMAHNFVSVQAAGFARVSLADTGGASTIFSGIRMMGGAVGVAALTATVVLVGPDARLDRPDLRPYHLGLGVAALMALTAAALASTIKNEDAASTRHATQHRVVAGSV